MIKVQYQHSRVLEAMEKLAPLGEEIEVITKDYNPTGNLLQLSYELGLEHTYVRVIMHRLKKIGVLENPRPSIWKVAKGVHDPDVVIKSRGRPRKNPAKEKKKKLIMAAGCKYAEWDNC